MKGIEHLTGSSNGNGRYQNEKVRVAIIGVGNCANAFVQGVHYYKDADPDARVPGLMHVDLGGYHIRDIEFSAAFDIDADKVGKDLSEAIWSGQNNTIKFTSANYAGLQFGGTYSFSNNTNFGNNRAYSAGVAYQFQGLKLAGAYSQANLGDGTNANGATSSAIGGIASQGRVRTYGAAAGYAFGPAQVGAAWMQARLDNNAVGLGTLRTDNYEVNAKYNLTPALGLGAAYTYTNAKINNGSTHWNQFGLQADYALSKRTDVYAQAVYQRAAKNGIGASIYNGNNFSDNLPSSSINQTAATVGLRHRF